MYLSDDAQSFLRVRSTSETLANLPDPLPADFAAKERQAIADALDVYAAKMMEGYTLTAIESYRCEAEAAHTMRVAVLYGIAAMPRSASPVETDRVAQVMRRLGVQP